MAGPEVLLSHLQINETADYTYSMTFRL